MSEHKPASGHEKIETNNFLMIVLILLVVAVGGLVEIVPLFFQRSTTQPVAGLKPLTALQLAGRDIYTREGCYNCHSQMIRALQAETLRYGHYSMAGEFVYDHPFQWGSKRTGPDLHRVGGKYPDSWHFLHMKDPRATSPGSIMPAYPWMYTDKLDDTHVEGKIITLRRLGVPYPAGYEQKARADMQAQATQVAERLKAAGMNTPADREIVAIIAYLQRLGTDAKAKPEATQASLQPAHEGGR